jgi:glycosyltransferase involved in cell wall biosynthesis
MISYAETIRTLNPTASILHLSGYVGRSGMGISSVVLGLMGAQTSMGADTQIWSCDNDASVAQVCQDFNQPRSAIVTYPTVGPARLCFSPSMLRAIGGEAGERFGVVHQHGMWQACSAAVNRWRARYQRPTVLAPHGSLEAYALGRSRLKKQLASLLYESRNVRSATCLHATAAAEVRSFRDFGAKNDIALIPNGVSEQWLSASGDAERFRRKYSVPLDKRVLFFLSRVTPKKGLPMLLGAIGDHRQRLRDYGGDRFPRPVVWARQT